jgi:hypothetical protein
MKRINTNINIINSDGNNFANFREKEDLYSKLTGVKDKSGENMEFIQIGDKIECCDNILKVTDINLKFENINLNTKHKDKNQDSMPENLIIEVFITAEFIDRV